MAYTRGAATAAQAARAATDRERAEVERLYAEGRALAQTAKTLRQKNANLEAAIAEQTEILEDKRAKLAQALADLGAAQHEADEAIRQAEDRAALIRELAYDQARALSERAYRTGVKKGDDAARAKHAILSKLTPAPKRRPGKVVDLEPQPLTLVVRDGLEGLEDATAEVFGYRRAKGIKAPGRQHKAAA